MLPLIEFQQIWSDDDLLEFEISISDGNSTFRNRVYAARGYLGTLVADLDRFKVQVYGGIYDLCLGEFGPEFASGAVHIRFHFQDRGIIHITARAQSEYLDFGRKNVASESTLYFKSEPALLDNFISSLKTLNHNPSTIASLKGVTA